MNAIRAGLTIFIPLVLFAPVGLWATPPATKTSADMQKSRSRQWPLTESFNLYFEGQRAEYGLPNSVEGTPTRLKELAFSWTGTVHKNTEFSLDVAHETTLQGESELLIKEAQIRWSPWPSLDFRFGRQLYPVGFLNTEDENRFVHRPSFYQDILPYRKSIDTGVSLSGQLWDKRVFIGASEYSGRVSRPGDARSPVPQSRPTLFTLGTQWSNDGRLALQSFKHDLSFLPSTQALGVMFNQELTHQGFDFQWFGEGWRVEQNQTTTSVTQGYYLASQVQYDWISVAYRWDKTQRDINSASDFQRSTEVLGQNLQLSFHWDQDLRLVVERFQEEGEIPLEDVWYVRLILDTNII